MQNYLDILMQNKFFLSDSSEDVIKTEYPKKSEKITHVPSKKIQDGGANNDKTIKIITTNKYYVLIMLIY